MSTLSPSGAPRAHEASVRLSTLVARATETLADAGVPSPDVDAELLAAHAFGLTRGALAAAAIRGDDAPAGTAAFDERAVVQTKAEKLIIAHSTVADEKLATLAQRAHHLGHELIIRTPIKRCIQIHEMQPLRPLLLPIQRGFKGSSVHFLTPRRALVQPHSLTINDINSGKKCETHRGKSSWSVNRSAEGHPIVWFTLWSVKTLFKRGLGF